MFEKKAILSLPLPISVVFDSLRSRYESTLYRQASTAAKGYIPDIQVIEIVENKRIEFRVDGRDPILRMTVGSWSWEYELYEISNTETEVTIRYTYGLWIALLGAGTIGHQAANEITETAISLNELVKRTS